MSRFLCALTVCAFLPLSAWAGEHRDAVMDVLNGIEQPATKADLDAIEGDVVTELKEIALDGEVATSRRGRAISALQHFPTDDVRSFLETRLSDGEKSLYQRKAISALGAGWGEGSIPTIKKYLTDRDDQLRMAAARTLGNIGGDEARGLLETRRKKEKVDAVKEVVERALEEVAQ